MAEDTRDPLETALPTRRKVVKGMLIALGASLLVQPQGGVVAAYATPQGKQEQGKKDKDKDKDEEGKKKGKKKK